MKIAHIALLAGTFIVSGTAHAETFSGLTGGFNVQDSPTPFDVSFSSPAGSGRTFANIGHFGGISAEAASQYDDEFAVNLGSCGGFACAGSGTNFQSQINADLSPSFSAMATMNMYVNYSTSYKYVADQLIIDLVNSQYDTTSLDDVGTIGTLFYAQLYVYDLTSRTQYDTYIQNFDGIDLIWGGNTVSNLQIDKQHGFNMSLSVPFVGGHQYQTYMYMECSAYLVGIAGVYVTGNASNASSSTCDASHSGYWNGLTNVTDSSGNPLSNFSLTSSSGIDYLYANALSPAPAGPLPPSVGGVPEPASWALMVSGFGLIGGALRRKRPVAIT